MEYDNSINSENKGAQNRDQWINNNLQDVTSISTAHISKNNLENIETNKTSTEDDISAR